MLLIEVLNAREVVRKRIGSLGEKLIGKIVDADGQVEKALIQEMELAFKEFGIEARILSVHGLKIAEKNQVQVSLQLREERKV